MASVLSKETIADIRSGLHLNGQTFIGGKFVDAASGKTFENVSPRDGATINKVASTDSEDVDRAVQAARVVFEKGTWRNMVPKDRKKVMLRFAQLFEEQRAEFALLETLDMGKPISESYGVDVNAVLETLQWYAECPDKIYDEVAPSGPNALGLITREPIGVVAAVVPWNFPMLMSAWKFAPALAMGNSVILKPASLSPLVSET